MAAETFVDTEPIAQRKLPTTKQLMSGDEAVAWGALDSGVCFASAYPGTPATDIQEALQRHADKHAVRCVWSINEKVAYESALAVGISGGRALVSMKQVGLNVAADAFINSCTAGTNGGLVLAVGDDPECHSSQNKQDTRCYRSLTETLLLEPSDSQEAYSMTRWAFRLSERYRLPIIIRLTSRTAYGCTPMQREVSDKPVSNLTWPKDNRRFFIVPTNSRRQFQALRARQDQFEDALASSSYMVYRDCTALKGERLGVLCTGIGAAFAAEMLPDDAGLMKVPGEPFPEYLIDRFVASHDRIVVLEEGDPILERRASALAKRNRAEVQGRLSGHLKAVGELQPEQISDALSGERSVSTTNTSPVDLPMRFPEICKPCGYHKVFGALKEIQNIATPSDIGCNSLGGLPPYSVMDGVWSMGSSIGVACGLAAIGIRRIVAIIGDSTFFHAGIPALIEAVHEGYNITVLLLDNGAAAMTGGQGVAHVASKPRQTTVDIVRLINAIGVQSCTPFDPHKLGQNGIKDLIEGSFGQEGVSVLLYRSQCGIYSPGYHTDPPHAITGSDFRE